MTRRVTAEASRASARLRVLWLIKGLGPGGAERLLSSAAGLRDRERFHYEAAYLLPHKAELRPVLEDASVRVHCLDAGREWDLSWAPRLRRLILEGRFDVVHVHSPYVAAIARAVVRSIPRRHRPRLVYTEHVAWSGYAVITRILNAITFGLDDAQIAVSNTVRDSLSRRRARKVEVVVHGVHAEVLRSALQERDEIRAELGIGPGEVMVATVANYRAQKDYPTLLSAARRVVDADAPVRFVAIGQGPLEREILALHDALGLGDHFQLLGYREDAARVVAGCDLFVLSSRFEGLPVALMEAISLGRPVVATRVAGTVDAVTDGVEALLVPPERPDELADAILRVAKDEQLRGDMAARAGARAYDFDLTPAVRRIEELYRQVARVGS